LPTEQQPKLVEKIRSGQLSATETEREAARFKKRHTGEPARGVRASVRRFVVGSATVQITFRKRDVTPADVLHVLERVKHMVEGDRDGVTSGGGSEP
jgi:hypothetical protein